MTSRLDDPRRPDPGLALSKQRWFETAVEVAPRRSARHMTRTVTRHGEAAVQPAAKAQVGAAAIITPTEPIRVRQ